MRWDKVDARWEKRRNAKPGDLLEDGVTFEVELWDVPGEQPLEVRVCTRKGHPMKDFCNTRETPKTSIVLHTTAGYGGFSTLMGGDGDGRKASAHFMLGRDGIPYLLVRTEYVAWHATWWNENSIGIEVDTICQLFKDGNNLHSEYGKKDVYCTLDDKNVYWEKEWPGRETSKYWATWTEDQYRGCARLIKALCHRHQIPRMILPEPKRYAPFQKSDRKKFKGVCTHLQIDPARRIDIGPFIDWDKLIQYGALEQGDCFNPGEYTAPGGPTTPSGGSGTVAREQPKPGGKKTPQGAEPLPPPANVDSHTVKVAIGHRGGRIALTVRKGGEPAPVTPKPGDLPAAPEEGKRDEFIRAALNFVGCPYKIDGKDPKEGLDGTGLVGLCMKRVGLVDDHKELDAGQIFAMWPFHGGSASSPSRDILPGDLAWFGKGDHDTDAQQYPMIYLGGGRVLGPIPAGGGHQGKVQVIDVREVPEHFAGWTHIDDLGRKATAGGHPGEAPEPRGEPITAALLPSAPAARYDALEALAAELKAKWDDGKGKVNLVGVKDLHGRCLISPRPDDWNDTLFACFLDDDGHKCSLELKASLNPGTDSAKADKWHLLEGAYTFRLEEKALRPDAKVRAWCDVDGLGAPRPEMKQGETKPADRFDGEVSGDFAATHIELAGGSGDTPQRRGPGTQVVWGGTAEGSPWGQLAHLVEKAGGKAGYLLLHGSDLQVNQAVIAKATPKAQGAGGDPGKDHPHQPQQAPADAAPDQKQQTDTKPQTETPKPKGPLFENGAPFPYDGHPARVWAHPRAASSGPRPLLVVLHGIEHGRPHPQLDDTRIHLGKLAGKLIDEGRVTPLVVAAPSSPFAQPWKGFELGKFVAEVVKQVEADGVQIDLDQVSVVGHSGAGCFGGAGLIRIASQGGKFDGHALKVFGIADTCINDGIARGYASGLKSNDTTVVYAIHKGAGGGNRYTPADQFAKALGATQDTMDFAPCEVGSEIDSCYVGGDPRRISIKIKKGKEQAHLAAWKAAGAYHQSENDHEAVPLIWTEWALQRFHSASEQDKAQPSPQPEPEPESDTAPVTGGDVADVPPAPPLWKLPGIEPRATGAAGFADASTGLFWPVRRSKNHMGRAVCYVGVDDKTHGGASARHFLANRSSGARFHVGIDVFGDYHDLIVAIEAGTIIRFDHFYEGVNRLLVRNDSNGNVINYGEVDAGSLKKLGLKVGAHVQPGQVIAEVGRMKVDSMLHFEMYPPGTTNTSPYFKKEGEKSLARYLNPTQYLLALAQNGR